MSPKKFFLFFDINDEDDYSVDNPPYRSAGSEVEARRISENWDGPNGLWFECELDKNDNPINMKPRPDIKLEFKKKEDSTIFTFVEGDLVNGLGSILGTYSKQSIPTALNNIRAYFQCVHFQYQDEFISNSDIEKLIANSTGSLLFTTNNESSFYVFRSELNQPSFK